MTAACSVFAPDSALPKQKMAEATAQYVNPAGQVNWDEMLARHPECSFFQSASWAATLTDTYGITAKYLTIHEGAELKALLPLMEAKSWVTGTRGVSLPFSDECEPICLDAAIFKGLIQGALALGRERGWKYIELRGGRKWLPDAQASLAFYTHIVDLNGDEHQLFERMEPSVRRAVRKAEKEGIRVEFSESLDSMRQFYLLFCRTRKKHGMPIQSFAFFENIHRHIISRKLGTIALARHNGVPVAGAVYFRFAGKAIYKFGASDESLQHLRGNNLVMWEAIKQHGQLGCATLHLGRTSLGNDGLRRFKQGWGTREARIEYFKYDLRKDCFLTDKDKAQGWHNKLFQRMPIWLSRMTGSALYRHWA